MSSSIGRLLVAALFCGACSEGVGTPCDTDSDCNNNLICVLAPDATPDKGGTCEENVAHDQAVAFDAATSTDDLHDASVTPDLSAVVPADFSLRD